MDKLIKLRAKVERLHNEYRNKKGAFYFRKALRTVLFIIDYMQEEPVIKNLEEAANRYATEGDELGGLYIIDEEVEAFKAGAEWQKQQLMAKAIDVTIAIPYQNGYGGYTQLVDSKEALPFGEKVKVLVIKEEKLWKK